MEQAKTRKLVDEIVITVKPYRMKRIMGWGASCNSCTGVDMARNKKDGRQAGIDHAVKFHRGQARMREIA